MGQKSGCITAIPSQSTLHYQYVKVGVLTRHKSRDEIGESARGFESMTADPRPNRAERLVIDLAVTFAVPPTNNRMKTLIRRLAHSSEEGDRE
jgi:hypothetical protein